MNNIANIKSDFAAITKVIAASVPVKEIHLFGSYA